MSGPVSTRPEGAQDNEPLEITRFYAPEVIGSSPVAAPAPMPRRKFRSGRRSLNTNWPVAAVLFLATCVSVFFAGMVPGEGALTVLRVLAVLWQAENPWPILQAMVQNGALFFAGLMTILLAHELGHFLQAKRYRVPANGPYFIPFPITPFGTMGAVIIQGAGVADRNSMFDISNSAPVSWLVFALPITALGIYQSHFAPVIPGHVSLLYSDPIIIK